MNYPVRVLHVIGIMNRGGAESMIMNLYRNIDRNKIQFDFIENSSEAAVFDEEIKSLGGRIYRCPHYNGKNHMEYVKWWKRFFLTHAGEYQIIHGHLGSTAAIYLKIAKKSGLFTIAHSHNSGKPVTFRQYLYAMYSYPTRFVADYFFSCSERAGIDRFGRRICSSCCYKVLNNAIQTKSYEFNLETRKMVRSELGYTEEVMVIGHVGRFATQKNHLFLIDIFKEVYLLNKNSKLLLVGDGDLRENCMNRVGQFGLSEAVKFLGVRSDVNELMQAMDMLVFPSLYEGLPVTLVEAQTAGLPCFISDGVPIECAITDGLVKQIPLELDAKQWAKIILQVPFGFERKGFADQVKNHGYDIKTTSKWLEEFYLEHSK